MAPLSLSDLPLTAVADYLPSTNRLLLAISLAPSSSFSEVGWSNAKLSTASKAVLASKEYWELDFAEISKCAGYKSKYYRANISDEDLRALLLSIDAKNTLKTLRLEGCTQIVGHSLEPLRGSIVLERLVLRGNATFAEPIVYSSIINAIYSSDKVLDRLELLHDFQSYVREARDDTVSPFHDICTNIQQTLLANGLCNCTKPFAQCSTCLKQGCTDCGNDFPPTSCNNCGETFCDDCDYSHECKGCQSVFCSACAQLDTVDDARCCRYCSDYHCFGCIEGQDSPCGECFVLHLPKSIARHQAQAEIARLRQQINQLQMNEDFDGYACLSRVVKIIGNIIYWLQCMHHIYKHAPSP